MARLGNAFLATRPSTGKFRGKVVEFAQLIGKSTVAQIVIIVPSFEIDLLATRLGIGVNIIRPLR